MMEQIKKQLDRFGGKVLCSCLILSALVNIFLVGYNITYKPACERRHLEVIDRTKDWVPSEEMAKGLAGASIGLEDGWEDQDDFFYIAECTYNEERYEWIIIFTPRDERAKEKRIVGIRKDLGLITIYQ